MSNKLRIPEKVINVGLKKELSQALTVVLANAKPKQDTYQSVLLSYRDGSDNPTIDYVEFCLNRFTPRNEKSRKIWEVALNQLREDNVVITPDMLGKLKEPSLFDICGQFRRAIAKKI